MSLPNEDSSACPIVRELSRHLRANSKSGIAACLAQLKGDPMRCRDFAKHGGLSILIKLLRSQNSMILNMSLSIMANACMSSDIRDKVRDYKIADKIIFIMKNLKLDSSVHCRTCRLIGNLSECSWHAQSLHNAGVVEVLATFLQLKTDKQTYLMAIRAIRNIWNSCKGSRKKILEVKAVKLVSRLFVMAREKCNDDEKYEDLMNACLKAICAFLITLDVRCGEQIQADKDKRGYQCLMQCCNDGNKIAIKCLYNLCRLTVCRLMLGSSGIVEQLIILIKSGNSELSEEILASLCLFCQDSVNRARINNSGGLELILMLLKKPELENYHFMLLEALVQFSYCDPSITILTKHDVLEILVTKLMNSVADTVADEEKDLGFNSNNKTSKKRYCDCMLCQKCSRTNEERYCKYTLRCFDGDSSPGSAASVSSSPPSTPPLLHYDFMIDTDNIGDDDYSPVYSDTEWTDNDEEPQDEEADSLKSCKSLTINVDNSHDTEKVSKKVLCDETALMLLNRLSVFPKPIDKLADPSTINPLLTYIRRTRKRTAMKILIRIVRNAVYFMPLLKQGFVFEVQNLCKGELIQELCDVAETGGAIGQLSSVLLRGEEQLKLIVAVTIPFLLKSRVTLKSLLHIHGGLRLIFRLLNEPSHELHERAIWSICQLAVTLKIHPETVDRCSKKINGDNLLRSYSRLCENNHSQPSSIVTFELDDGTTVDAYRRTLCECSDAFSAMLEGNFCESGKRRVRLKNVSRDALNTLILAASGAAYQYQSIESLLDAVLLADKFLMPDLLDALTNSSLAKLNHENFSLAWCWARTNACHELRCCCVKSFLTATMTRSEMVQAFRDFSATEAFDEFLRDIQEIIMDVLCQFY